MIHYDSIGSIYEKLLCLSTGKSIHLGFHSMSTIHTNDIQIKLDATKASMMIISNRSFHSLRTLGGVRTFYLWFSKLIICLPNSNISAIIKHLNILWKEPKERSLVVPIVKLNSIQEETNVCRSTLASITSWRTLGGRSDGRPSWFPNRIQSIHQRSTKLVMRRFFPLQTLALSKLEKLQAAGLKVI